MHEDMCACMGRLTWVGRREGSMHGQCVWAGGHEGGQVHMVCMCACMHEQVGMHACMRVVCMHGQAGAGGQEGGQPAWAVGMMAV